jgi:hypothetical protein
MFIYGFLAATILCALAALFILWRNASKGLAHGLPGLLLALSLGVFIYLYGTWLFLSVYVKYVFALLFIATFMVAVGRKNRNGARRPGWWNVLLSLFFTAVFSLLSVLYFIGTTGKPYGIANLAMPLKNGKYFVFQGGKGFPTNLFHYELRGAVLAMDIVKLNKSGNRANHIFSTDLADYAIFNDTIYSPCAGIVARTENDNPDNIPPSHERGPTNTNLVLIDAGAYYVFMAHMRKGSVLVHAGDTLATGQPIGRVGNSGFSLEPHLHIQVQAKTNTGIPWYREKPLLIAFYGKSYLLFQEINAN